MPDWILPFLESYGAELGVFAALIAILEFFFKPFRWLFASLRKPAPVELGDETVRKLTPEKSEDGPKLTVPEFIRIRRELKT